MSVHDWKHEAQAFDAPSAQTIDLCWVFTMSDTKDSRAAYPDNNNVTEVYAIHGADPEVLAYAMAKYSRSSLSITVWWVPHIKSRLS